MVQFATSHLGLVILHLLVVHLGGIQLVIVGVLHLGVPRLLPVSLLELKLLAKSNVLLQVKHQLVQRKSLSSLVDGEDLGSLLQHLDRDGADVSTLPSAHEGHDADIVFLGRGE